MKNLLKNFFLILVVVICASCAEKEEANTENEPINKIKLMRKYSSGKLNIAYPNGTKNKNDNFERLQNNIFLNKKESYDDSNKIINGLKKIQGKK